MKLTLTLCVVNLNHIIQLSRRKGNKKWLNQSMITQGSIGSQTLSQILRKELINVLASQSSSHLPFYACTYSSTSLVRLEIFRKLAVMTISSVFSYYIWAPKTRNSRDVNIHGLSRTRMILWCPSCCHIHFRFNSSVEQHICSWCPDIGLINRRNIAIIKIVPSIIVNQLHK